MKPHLLLLLIVLVTVTACNDERGEGPIPNTLVGTWKLTAVLADPGDGSGTFQPVESSQVIVIYGDNTFVTTERLCGGLYQGPPQNTGRVDFENSVFWIDNCDFGPGSATLNFYQIQDELVITFPCIEPCGNKYVRLDGSSVLED